MENTKLKEFSKTFDNREVRGFVDENNKEWFNLEDVSICLGFCKSEVKNDKTYFSIRWKRIKEHIEKNDIEVFDREWSNKNNNFIDEYGIYDLSFSSGTDSAKNFRKWVSRELLPQIRKQFKIEMFDMFSINSQKEIMNQLREYAEVDSKIYMFANKEVNKIVSEIWDIEPPIKKSNMKNLSDEMLVERQKILDEWVQSYKLSISKATANHMIRKKYNLKQIGKYKNFKN